MEEIDLPYNQQIIETQLFVGGKFEFYFPDWHGLKELCSKVKDILSDQVVVGYSGVDLKWLATPEANETWKVSIIDDNSVEKNNFREMLKAAKKYENSLESGEFLGSSASLALKILYNDVSKNPHFVMDDDFDARSVSFDFGGYFLEDQVLTGEVFGLIFKDALRRVSMLRDCKGMMEQAVTGNKDYRGVWLVREPNSVHKYQFPGLGNFFSAQK
jgi:hypothetical protein